MSAASPSTGITIAPASGGKGVRAISVRLYTPNRGAWFADVDIDPDDPTNPPTGAVVINLAASKTTMTGTVDPRLSGRFASTVRQRIVGGAGAWDALVPAQHFHADNGIPSTAVYAGTATGIGETVNDPNPVTLGVDFVRSSGPASRVFGDRDWYVDPAGVTQVATRPVASADPTLEVLGYDPNMMRAEVSVDALVLPGTVLTDTSGAKRWDGALTVRDVEQTFTQNGSRAFLTFATADVSRLAAALVNMVREASGRTYLRTYAYRYVSRNMATRLNLQAVDPTPGLPDLVACPIMPGMAGLGAKLTPGQIVLVAFVAGDPTKPVIVSFDTTVPIESTLDATATVHIGPSANRVEIAGDGGAPVARAGDTVQVFFPPTMAVAGTLSGAPFTGVITIMVPGVGVVSSGSAKAGCS